MDKVRKINECEYELEINPSVTISIKLEDSFLEVVDIMVKKYGYKNRSDLIRDAIMEYLSYLEKKQINYKTH
jgi:metal-responsive CopG/Arc/MetJ family transcriptional regulator